MLLLFQSVCSGETVDAEILFQPPENPPAVFSETFQDGLGQWKNANDDSYPGEFELGKGKENTLDSMSQEIELLVTEGAKKYGFISSEFHANTEEGFVFQYEVRLHEGLQCGGAYMKLLAEATQPDDFDDKTRYSVMFGPDKCGSTNKVHFIVQVFNPASKEFIEHHLTSPPTIKSDKKTHLYTLVTRGQTSYEIFIDLESVKTGNFDEDFEPAFQPEKEIDDAEDKKPDDWVDEKMMDDPEDSKPEDWDEDAPAMINDPELSMPECWQENEPLEISDPTVSKPDDWDDEDDGEFEAPLVDNPACTEECGCGEWAHPTIPNPDYKGKWYPKKIENPDYKGEWAPRKIANPAYYEIKASDRRVNDIKQVAIDIWTMQGSIGFDNIFLGTDPNAAHEFAQQSFVPKQEAEKVAAKKKAEGSEENLLDTVKQAVMDNPGKAFGSAIMLVSTLLYLCCCMGGDEVDDREVDEIDVTEAAATAGGTENQPKTSAAEEEVEEEEEEEAEPKPKAKRKKRKD